MTVTATLDAVSAVVPAAGVRHRGPVLPSSSVSSQFPRLAGFAVTVLSVGSTMVTVTVAVGWVSSTTVYVFVPPSLTISQWA